MPGPTPRSFRSVLQPIVGTTGWTVLGGLLLVAALWASEPGGADPPASSWRAGRTANTWDWERHWNYWTKLECAEQGVFPGGGWPTCLDWSSVGRVWKACGPVIRPPDPGSTNTCNIGSPGGHSPHGNGLTVKYTYLGRHHDRTGPTYPVCVGDRSLPANTSPGNCGTWVVIPHQHCPDDPNAHPPDCSTTSDTTSPPTTDTTPSSTSITSLPTSTTGATTSTTGATTSTTRATTSGTGATTPTTRPPYVPQVCEDPEAIDAFRDAVEDQPTPGLGIQPADNGYVRVPMRAFYTHSPRVSLSTRIDGDRVILSLWVSRLSWSFTDLGTLSGTDLGDRTLTVTEPTPRLPGR